MGGWGEAPVGAGEWARLHSAYFPAGVKRCTFQNESWHKKGEWAKTVTVFMDIWLFARISVCLLTRTSYALQILKRIAFQKHSTFFTFFFFFFVCLLVLHKRSLPCIRLPYTDKLHRWTRRWIGFSVFMKFSTNANNFIGISKQEKGKKPTRSNKNPKSYHWGKGWF